MKKLFPLLFIFFISSFLFSLLASPAQAALGDILNSPDMSQEKYVIGNTSQSGILDSINNGFMCGLSGCYDSSGELAKSGVIPVMGQTLAAFYVYPPASSTEYFADVLNNMGLPGANKALAQSGTGYTMLSPFLQIWKAFRNMAYSLYIIIFVVIGIMIMLRTKVNAQTIISIQTALPNLLITLILITFSYAIAGFMIDLMYFLIYFIVYLAQANNLIEKAADFAIPRLFENNAYGVIFKGENAITKSVSDSITGALFGLSTNSKFWEKILDSPVSSLASLIVAVALAIQMLKLVWTLGKAYIMLTIQVFTSPIQILMNAMPGSKAFSGWLKKTASYLAPFPIVAAMFIFAAILIGENNVTKMDGSKNDDIQNPFNVTNAAINRSTVAFPPFIFSERGVGREQEDILGIIGFMIILMTPAAAKMAQDALQTKESPYTSEIGAGLSAGWQYGGMPIRGVASAYERQHQYRQQAKIFGGEAYRRPGTGLQNPTEVGNKEPQSK